MKKIRIILAMAMLLTACAETKTEMAETETEMTEAKMETTEIEMEIAETKLVTEENIPEIELRRAAAYVQYENAPDVDANTVSELQNAAVKAIEEYGFEPMTPTILPKNVWVLSANADTARLVATEYWRYPYTDYVLKMSENDGVWQLDELEMEYNVEYEISLLYDIFAYNSDKWENILSGGELGDTVEIDGTKYQTCKNGMTIAEMKEFFADILDGEILADHTEKYIENVYLERDGALYRKADAARWYLLEYLPNPNDGMITSGGKDSAGNYVCEIFQDFRDPEIGEVFTERLKLVYSYPKEKRVIDTENRCYYLYYDRKIASEIPIMETTKTQE